MDQDFYSVKEFAAKLKVSPQTIRRAIKNGRIQFFRAGSTARSAIRIYHSEISRLGVFELQEVLKKMIKENAINEISK